jgi:hypothetical protein
MAYELAALHVGGLTPQRADMNPHRVQRRLPVDALGNGHRALPAQGTHQLPGAADAVIVGKKVRPGRWLPTHVGQQAVTGKHFDGPAMPGLLQRHHGIDHGQARADDQHPSLRVELRMAATSQGIERRGVQATGFGLRRARGGEHAGGQHGERPLQSLSVEVMMH